MNGQDYEQLTLFQEDSHASLFPWLESKRGSKTIVTSGRRCCELSDSLRRVWLSVRTYLESCELPPGEWSRIWSVKGITSSCLILKLRLSELRTGESGSRLLPTVTATVGEKSRNHRDSSGRPGLQIAAMLWKTPTTPSGGTIRSEEISQTGMTPDGKKRQVTLEKQVRMSNLRMWPTPAARDCKGSNSMEHLTRESGNRNHVDQLANAAKLNPGVSESQASGQLNPTWVEWLMGFPIGWTDLGASATP